MQTLAQVPPMLYVSMVLFPLFLFGFLTAAKPKRAVSAAMADPVDQLKERHVDIGREALSGVFLAATVACGAAAIIILTGVIGDYKNSRGIFAAALAPATLPPGPSYVLPPAPELNADGSVAGQIEQIKEEKKGFLD